MYIQRKPNSPDCTMVNIDYINPFSSTVDACGFGLCAFDSVMLLVTILIFLQQHQVFILKPMSLFTLHAHKPHNWQSFQSFLAKHFQLCKFWQSTSSFVLPVTRSVQPSCKSKR
jgi:hypothetical protein